MDLKIDKQFADYLPGLSPAELAALTESLKAGFDTGKGKIIVWAGHGVIVDGHNRYRICEAEGIAYEVEEREFADRDAVLAFIENTHWGRRHWTPAAMSYMRGREYNRIKLAQARPEKSDQIDHLKTCEKLADKYGVGPATIRRDGKFARILDGSEDGDADAYPGLVQEFSNLGGDQCKNEWVLKADAAWRPNDIKALYAGRPKGLETEDERRRAVDIWRGKKSKHNPDGIEEETPAKAIRRIINEDPPAALDNPPRVWLASWEDWLPEQPECDLLLTDPPYSTDIEDVELFAQTWLPAALDKVKPTGRAYVCIGAYPDELWAYLSIEPPSHLKLEQVLVWTYRNTLGPSAKHAYNLNWQAVLYYIGQDAPPLNCSELNEQFAVQDINAPDGRQDGRYHTWQKPDELARRFVKHSTEPGQLVLDPFCCTGTFMLAAHELSREGRGCDIDEENLAIAIKRGCRRVG